MKIKKITSLNALILESIHSFLVDNCTKITGDSIAKEMHTIILDPISTLNKPPLRFLLEE